MPFIVQTNECRELHYSPEELKDYNYATRYVHLALDIGKQMLYDGSEVERVEDTLKRICLAFGAKSAEVFAMTSVVIITVSGENYKGITEIERITELGRNLGRLTMLNNLSRDICNKHLTIEEAEARMEQIRNTRWFGVGVMMLAYALLSAAFTIFFGGCPMDGVAAAIIGVIIAPVENAMVRLKLNRFLRIGLCSFICGSISVGLVASNIGESVDLIDIGNIMIFIPGVIFTTAIQEIFSDNMTSGFAKIVETGLITFVIATGFVVANMWWSGKL